MKKVMFFGLMVMMSMMVFGTSAAEERLKTDNMIASIAQEPLATEQTSEETAGAFLISKLDMEIYELPSNICSGLRNLCKDVSPANQEDICGFWTPTNCPYHQ